MSDTVHISSIVVTADPTRLGEAESALHTYPIAELAVKGPAGKLIVTLETPDEGTMVQALTDIQLMPGVFSAALVYHATTDSGTDPASQSRPSRSKQGAPQ